ncbi:TonB-linked outer membrane protein, SusC/RagA family [bacterium A37T11]|nr:TonB-linked outer membrane protein, SusC/RagA family [bacterium A37T11]
MCKFIKLNLWLIVIWIFSPLASFAQQSVYGTVVDSTGAILSGVSVVVKDKKSIGTTTDANGKFILDVPPKAVLVFTMVGFDEQQIDVGAKKDFRVVLLPSSSQLDDVVVVAFGTQKKKEVVGSVTTINPQELKVPSSNLTTALAGRLAGVVAYQRSGEPGQDNADFFIRGVTTFGYKKDPLILVDGIELTSTDLARMQIDDIASFSILKDAASTALYGARGANGIILITTKQGVEGKAKLSFRIENSISAPTKNVELADPTTYMQLNNEAVLTRNPTGETPYFQSKIDNTIAGKNPYVYPAVDWMNMLFKDYTQNQRGNLNISGGGSVARYYLAGTFNQDNGILKVDKRNNFNSNIDLKSYGLRSNVDINVTKSTIIGVKLYGTFDDYSGPIDGGAEYYKLSIRSDPVSFPAFYPKDADHQYVEHVLFGNTPDQVVNPYAEMVKGYKDYSRSLMLAQFDVKQDLNFITEGLNLQALFNITRSSYFDVTRSYKPYWYQIGSYDKLANTYTLESINENTGTEYLDYTEGPKQVMATTYIQSTLNYSHTFGKIHGISGLLVFLMQNQLSGNAGTLQTSLPHRNIGLSGRFTYALNSKYFAEFNFGYNGSERFYKTQRFGFFPSAGVAWQVSNESFWKPLSKVVTNLKLRGTYGIIGNDAIGSESDRFFYLSDVNMDDPAKGASFGFDNTYHDNGVTVRRYDNPLITWEKSFKTNIGMDMSLFNNVNFIVDFWKEKRTNILMDRTNIPVSLGLSTSTDPKINSVPKANVGVAEGKGIDASVDYSKFFNNGFWIQGRANFTYALSNFSVYEEPNYANAPWKSHVGYPLSQNWGYLAERLFVDDAEVANSPTQNFGQQTRGGDIKYRDVNEDGKITTLDQVPIGYPTSPNIIYGFGASVGYKSFDVSCFFQGLAQESFWIEVASTSPFATSVEPNTGRKLKNQLLQAYADDHWSESNRNPYALWPRLSTTVNPNNSQSSTWFMRDGTFLRLKSAEIGFTLPEKQTKKIYLEKLRIYANGTNLLSWSSFKLWDVEMAGNGLAYPVQRVINLGVQASF